MELIEDLRGKSRKLGLETDRPSRLTVQNLRMTVLEQLAFCAELIESLDRGEITGPSLTPIYTHCSPVGVVSKKDSDKMRPIMHCSHPRDSVTLFS